MLSYTHDPNTLSEKDCAESKNSKKSDNQPI